MIWDDFLMAPRGGPQSVGEEDEKEEAEEDKQHEYKIRNRRVSNAYVYFLIVELSFCQKNSNGARRSSRVSAENVADLISDSRCIETKTFENKNG